VFRGHQRSRLNAWMTPGTWHIVCQDIENKSDSDKDNRSL